MSGSADQTIDISFPEGEHQLLLRIRVGGCRLRLRPGGGDRWVTGTYHDPTGALPCRVVPDGRRLEITQGLNLSGWAGSLGGVPTLDLMLGDARPFQLVLEGGASESTLDLGGVPLTDLELRQGAGKYEIDFSAPNPVMMDELDIGGGAFRLEMRNLANANFREMEVDGGASAYRFDFGGNLVRDAQVKLSTGVSVVELSIPSSIAAKVRVESTLGSIDLGDGFTKREGAFWNDAAVAGRTPVLTIRANVALGMLRLRQSPHTQPLPAGDAAAP
ncbi:MAG: hypothetical protein QJR03_04910 [Sphaerobacter sp.]|nr:hypothetical protein [Sphaerobacter sp.]